MASGAWLVDLSRPPGQNGPFWSGRQELARLPALASHPLLLQAGQGPQNALREGGKHTQPRLLKMQRRGDKGNAAHSKLHGGRQMFNSKPRHAPCHYGPSGAVSGRSVVRGGNAPSRPLHRACSQAVRTGLPQPRRLGGLSPE